MPGAKALASNSIRPVPPVSSTNRSRSPPSDSGAAADEDALVGPMDEACTVLRGDVIRVDGRAVHAVGVLGGHRRSAGRSCRLDEAARRSSACSAKYVPATRSSKR